MKQKEEVKRRFPFIPLLIAMLLAFLGGALLLTNAGTPNYYSRFNTSSTLIDGLIYDNNISTVIINGTMNITDDAFVNNSRICTLQNGLCGTGNVTGITNGSDARLNYLNISDVRGNYSTSLVISSAYPTSNTIGIKLKATSAGTSYKWLTIEDSNGFEAFNFGLWDGFYSGVLRVNAPAGQGSGSGINFYSNGGANTAFFQLDGAGNFVVRDTGTGGTYFDYTDSFNIRNASLTNILRADSMGKIAIGHTTPTGQLHVIPSAIGEEAVIAQGAVGQVADIFQVLDSSSNKLLVVDNQGYLGVGTDNPAYQVHVYKDLNGTNSITVENSNLSTATTAAFRLVTGGYGFVFEQYGNGYVGSGLQSAGNTLLYTTSPSGGLGVSSASASMYFATNGANTDDVMLSINDRKIGINTTNPATMLDINDVSTQTSYGGLGISDQGISLNNNIQSAGYPIGLQFGSYRGYDFGGIFGVGTNMGGYTIGDIVFAQRRGVVDVTYNETMRIVGSTGNVGIGTNTPSQRLTVVGNANVTGNITGNLIYMFATFHNDSEPVFSVSTSNVSYNMTFDTFKGNGFINASASKFTTQIAGTYAVDYSVSFAASTSGGEYSFTIFLNGIEQEHTESYRSLTSANVWGNTGGAGYFISANAGDNISLTIQDESAPAHNVKLKAHQLKVLRVGD